MPTCRPEREGLILEFLIRKGEGERERMCELGGCQSETAVGTKKVH